MAVKDLPSNGTPPAGSFWAEHQEAQTPQIYTSSNKTKEPEEYVEIPVEDRIAVTPSDFTRFAFRLPDKKNNKMVPFSFAGRLYLPQIYDESSKRVLSKCARQTEKSTRLGNLAITYAAMISGFNVLFVSPTNTQTKRFSRDRIKDPIDMSEYLQTWVTEKGIRDNIYEKQFVNKSKIMLKYAFLNADRVRGIATDMVMIDEVQDILTDNIPVIEECASHSDFKIFSYSGTPKTLDNTIEYYWTNMSTQNEWVVPCDHCGSKIKGGAGRYWNILGMNNISPDGLICDRCGAPLIPDHPDACWASMNPSPRIGGKTVPDPFKGYRIPQLIVPWLKWEEIWTKFITYPQSQFHNEVLGLSYDSGARPLTREDVAQNCDPRISMGKDFQVKIMRKLRGKDVFAGIDWGTAERSYTVMTLGAYLEGRFTIFYIHRFDGPDAEPQVQIEKIKRLLSAWNVRLVGCDYGGGFWQNDDLSRLYGVQRIHKMQYTNVASKFKMDPGLGRWMVNRNEVMTDIFQAIKRGDVFRFPKWEEFQEPFAMDMLNIFSEYNEKSRTSEYNHLPDCPDDSFHSILYCFTVSSILYHRPDVFATQNKGERRS